MPTKLKKWWPAVVLALLLIAGVFGYAMGYRLVAGPQIVRLAPLTINGLPAGAQVYIDNRLEGTPKGGTLIAHLAPGEHIVLAGEESYAPWVTIYTLLQKGGTLHALLIPASVETTILTGAKAKAVETELQAATLPSETDPLTLGCATVWVSYNQILAEALTDDSCTPPPFLCIAGDCARTVVYAAGDAIRSVTPYPGRLDALLVATGRSVYALSLDPREPRTLVPVLISRAPVITIDKSGLVVGKDGPSYFSFDFEAIP